MKPLSIAALCVGLAAVPLVAKAADLLLVDASGQPVAVLVPSAEQTMGPAEMFAQQDAILDRMMQTMSRMNAAFMSGPMSMDPATFGNAQPGSAVIITSFSDGRSSCSRTVTYDQRSGGGGSPVVQVRQTGDGCGSLPVPPTGATVPAALPSDAAPHSFGPANPNSPQLTHVVYRHAVVKSRPHHL